MKIFQRVQKQYAILGIGSSNQLTPKSRFNERVLAGFLFFGCILISQLMYIFRVASDFMEYMESVCAASSTVIIFVCFATIVFKQTTLFESIDMIEKLIDIRSKYPKSERFLSKTNGQVERLSEIVYTSFVKIGLQFMILPKCIICFGIYFITDSGRDSFQLPAPLWFPFDTQTPLGYLIACISAHIGIGYDFVINATTLGLGSGAFWFAIAATKEIKHILLSINVKAQSRKNHSNEIRILFSEFIYAHGVLKQVERNFSDILQPILMSLFTWSLLAISGAMLIVQIEVLQHGNVMSVLLNATLNGILGLVIVFIACELGQRMSGAFEEIDITLDMLKWYLFPIEIKRMLPMIIVNAQQPVELECFGSTTCTREIFRKILHSAYSYFTVLNQLGG